MNREVIDTYNTLRAVWSIPAAQALSMARAKFNLDESRAEYLWEQEQESPRDIFGEPDPINGPFYDPDAEHLYCVIKSADGAVLDSLGMVESPFPEVYGSVRNYGYLVECEMATEAWARLLDLVSDHEETLS